MKRDLKSQRLVGLFLLAAALFNYPLLSAANGGVVFGIPTLYVFLFVVWALVIGLAALIVERTR